MGHARHVIAGMSDFSFKCLHYLIDNRRSHEMGYACCAAVYKAVFVHCIWWGGNTHSSSAARQLMNYKVSHVRCANGGRVPWCGAQFPPLFAHLKNQPSQHSQVLSPPTLLEAFQLNQHNLNALICIMTASDFCWIGCNSFWNAD